MAKQERNPQRGGSGASQPITRHPLFPAIVALWFAALFGVVGVLLGTATIERVVAATGLAKAIPMAAPPLGTTARLLVALGLTGIGALVGALIGLRLSARNSARAEAMRDLSGGALDEIEEEEPAVGRLPGRRRGFVAPIAPIEAEPEALAVPAPASAPAPGIFQLSDLDDDEFDAAHAEGANPSIAQIESEIEHHEPADSAPIVEDLSDDEDEHPSPAHLTDAFSPAAWADPAYSPAHHDDEDEAEEEAPVARLFEAYARTLEARDAAASSTMGDPVAEHVSGEQPDAPAPVPPPSPAAERIAAASLDDLSHVELLERLALAMEEQRRKLALAQATSLSVVPFSARDAQESQTQEPEEEHVAESDVKAPAPAVAPVLQRLSSLGTSAPFAPPPFAPPPFGARQPLTETEADDAPVQPAANFASPAPGATEAIGGWSEGDEAIADAGPDFATPDAPAPVPAALRPVSTTAFDEDDTVPGYIPPRHFIMPTVATPTPDDAGERPVAGLAGGHVFTPSEEDEEEDETLATFAEADEFADDGDDIVEEGVLDEGYSSLLGLQRRAEPRNRLISIEEEAAFDADTDHAIADGDEHAIADGTAAPFAQPPLPGARLFDPPGRPDPAETEKALRAALATLQRMSGTA